jgi:uncharacterized protein
MKTLVLFLLTGYKIVISPLLHQLLGQKSLCRYEVSCSEYAKQVIEKRGVIRGVKLALVRFLSCQPFSKSYATV